MGKKGGGKMIADMNHMTIIHKSLHFIGNSLETCVLAWKPKLF